jgi:hypothetical protein
LFAACEQNDNLNRRASTNSKRSLAGSHVTGLGISNIMINKWSLGPLIVTSFGVVMLLGTAPATAQPVYTPVPSAPNSPYSPILVAMEPPGCPLNSGGQWAFINNGWLWCPPTAANGTSVAYGYGSPATYGYSNGVPAVYGYSNGAPAGYGYSAPVAYGYSCSPVAYGYSAPVAYSSTSLTGSPILDMVLGVTASSLIASQFQPNYQQAYYPGYSPYGPSFASAAYPGQSYAPYGYPNYGQSFPVGYQGYPAYGSGTTYIRNVYRNNELAWIARDQRRVAFLRAENANPAEIGVLQRRIELNEHRIAWQRATERRDIDARASFAHRGLIAVPRNRLVAARVDAPRATAVRMNSPRMAPWMVAPRMLAPRMALRPNSAGAGQHPRR